MIKLTHNNYDHKGKIENTQISIDIPFACYHSFGVQPAEQGWLANPNRRPKPGRHYCCDDHANLPHADQNNRHHLIIHHDVGDCLADSHAHPCQHTNLVNL